MDYLHFYNFLILLLFFCLVFFTLFILKFSSFSFYIFSVVYVFLFFSFFSLRFYTGVLSNVLVFTWFELPNSTLIRYTLLFNVYSAEFSMLLLFLGFLIHYFSYDYFVKDPDFTRFSILLGYFIMFMLLLINTDSVVFTFIAWEGIGLLSFLLVSFWYSKINTFKSGMKVLFYNRIGDFFFFLVVGLFLYFTNSDSFSGSGLLGKTTCLTNFELSGKINLMYFISFSLFLVILSKSAQFGFHIWLLEAMEAPLPASSLIHSATLVCAGLVLFFKSSIFIFYLGPISGILLLWASLSACLLSFSALFNYDIKKILAYSTGSHVSLMLLLSVSGGASLGYSYTLIHASTKVFIFLLFGFIINANGGVRDLRKMGGFFRFNNLTILGFIGIVFLSSLPFFPLAMLKDLFIIFVFNNNYFFDVIMLLVLMASLFNYLYMGRLFIKIFFGDLLGTAPSYFKHFAGGTIPAIQTKYTKIYLENKLLIILLSYILLLEFSIFFFFQLDFLFAENRVFSLGAVTLNNGFFSYLVSANMFFFFIFFYKFYLKIYK